MLLPLSKTFNLSVEGRLESLAWACGRRGRNLAPGAVASAGAMLLFCLLKRTLALTTPARGSPSAWNILALSNSFVGISLKALSLGMPLPGPRVGLRDSRCTGAYLITGLPQRALRAPRGQGRIFLVYHHGRGRQ